MAAANPEVPRWFVDLNLDLTHRLSAIEQPVLLLWGDKDPVSPIAVGERLASLLPQAVLRLIPNGRHDLAQTHAEEVARLITVHVGHETNAG